MRVALCSIGKIPYRWPLAANEQDVTVYKALLRQGSFDRIYQIIQSENGKARIGHSGRIVAVYLPRSCHPLLDYLTFQMRAFATAWRLRREGVALVQVSDPVACAGAGLLVKWFLGLPLLVHVQGTPFSLSAVGLPGWRRWFARQSARLLCRVGDAVRFVSRRVMEQAIRAGAEPQKLVFVPARCDTRIFDRSRCREVAEGVRRRWQVSPQAPVALFVGTLAAHKGVAFLLRALPQVLPEFPELTLLLVGSGELAERLRREALELGVASHVRFCGKVPYADVPSYMAAADVLVLPSLDEGMPRVILEAMAMELPVVAARVGGVPELVREGETGLLVQPANADELAQALIQVLRLGTELRAWGRRARAEVESHYGFELGIQRYAELLAGLSSARRR